MARIPTLDGFYIIDLPIPVTKRILNGNGGKQAGMGHNIRQIGDSAGIMYGNGCIRHHCADCFSCPEEDCDYDQEVESRLRKRLGES